MRLAVVGLFIVTSLAGCAVPEPEIVEIHHYYERPPRTPVMAPDGVIEWRAPGGEWGPAPTLTTISTHEAGDRPLPLPFVETQDFEVRYTGNMTNLSLQWRTPSGTTNGPATFTMAGPGSFVVGLYAQRDDGASFWLESIASWSHTWTLAGTIPADTLTDATRHEFYIPVGNSRFEVTTRAVTPSEGLGRAATLALSYGDYTESCRDGRTGIGADETDHFLDGESWGRRILISYGAPPAGCMSRDFPNLEAFDYEITVEAVAQGYGWFIH